MNKKYNGYDFMEDSLINKCTPNRFKGNTITDFKEWKRTMRVSLSEILGLNKMFFSNGSNELVESHKRDGYILEKYVINTLNNLKMPYYKLTPEVKNNKAVIAIHGHGSDGKEGLVGLENKLYEGDIEKYNYNYAFEFLDKGYVVYVPDLLGAGERTLGIYNDRRAECNDINNALISMGMCLQGVILAELKILTNNISKEFKEIGCCGFSGGGHSALWLSAMEDRLSFSVISGFFHSFKDVLIYTNRCGCNFIPHLWEMADMADILAMAAPLNVYLETGKYDNLNGIRGIDGVKEQLEIANNTYRLFNKEIKLNVCEGRHQWYGSVLEEI